MCCPFKYRFAARDDPFCGYLPITPDIEKEIREGLDVCIKELPSLGDILPRASGG
jgi:hypothetical protein